MNYKYINEKCLSLAIRKPGRLITCIYDNALSELHIRSTQFSMLVALHSTDKKTLTALSKDMCMDRTTLTRCLHGLRKIGLIDARESLNKRCKEFGLTEQGLIVLRAGEPLWARIQEGVTRKIGPVWLNELNKTMENLTHLLQQFESY